jgi:hypothetical protein
LLNSETARLRNDEILMMFGGTCYGGHFEATVRKVAHEAPKTGKKKIDSTLLSDARRFPRRTTPNAWGGGDTYFFREHVNTPSDNTQKVLPLRVDGTYTVFTNAFQALSS